MLRLSNLKITFRVPLFSHTVAKVRVVLSVYSQSSNHYNSNTEPFRQVRAWQAGTLVQQYLLGRWGSVTKDLDLLSAYFWSPSLWYVSFWLLLDDLCKESTTIYRQDSKAQLSPWEYPPWLAMRWLVFLGSRCVDWFLGFRFLCQQLNDQQGQIWIGCSRLSSYWLGWRGSCRKFRSSICGFQNAVHIALTHTNEGHFGLVLHSRILTMLSQIQDLLSELGHCKNSLLCQHIQCSAEPKIWITSFAFAGHSDQVATLPRKSQGSSGWMGLDQHLKPPWI